MMKYLPAGLYLTFLAGLGVAVGVAAAHHDPGVLAIVTVVALIAILFGHQIVTQAKSGGFA